MRTGRNFFERARAALLLCAAALLALHASAGAALAQDKSGEETGKADAANGIRRPPAINIKPLEDVSLAGRLLVEQGKIGANTTVELSATAERNDDGTLRPDTLKIEGVTNDENVMTLARQFITAVSQSKILFFLEGAKEVSFRFKLDEREAFLSLASEVASEQRAAQLANGYAALLYAAALSKKGTQEGELYRSIKVDSDGKVFKFAFEMPREAAGRMMEALLAGKSADAQPKD